MFEWYKWYYCWWMPAGVLEMVMVWLWIPRQVGKHRKIRRSQPPTRPPYWEIGNQARWYTHKAADGASKSANEAFARTMGLVEFYWYHVGEVVLKWAISPYKHHRATKSKAGTTHRAYRLRSVPVSIGKQGRLLMILAITMGSTIALAHATRRPENGDRTRAGHNGKSMTDDYGPAIGLMARKHQPKDCVAFDTDSVPIQIDNGATRTMSFA